MYPGWRENYCNEVAPEWAPIGQFFKLNLTPAQINAGNYPAWQKTILKTMSRYGMYVGDQGANSAFELQTESQFTYSSFGQENPWTGFLRSQGADGSLGFDNLGKQFWLDHLVAIDPCVIERTCPAMTAQPVTIEHEEAPAAQPLAELVHLDPRILAVRIRATSATAWAS